METIKLNQKQLIFDLTFTVDELLELQYIYINKTFTHVGKETMMILEDLRKALPKYKLKNITKDEYADLFEFQQTNPDYFSMQPVRPVTFEDSVKSVKSSLRNITYSKKYYIGFFHNDKLEATLDYTTQSGCEENGSIREDTVWIDLFMINGNLKRKGIGSNIIRNFTEVLRRNGICKIQLSCTRENEESFYFWAHLGFYEIEEFTTAEEESQTEHSILMELKLNQARYQC